MFLFSITAASCGTSDSDIASESVCSDSDPTVNTTSGPVCGVLGQGGYPDRETRKPVWSYKGIQYAATTGGSNRWLAASDPEPWTTPAPAKQFGPACAQFADDRVSGGDKCLSVSVFTPSAPGANNSLPVMAFIHGGAFYMGASSQPNYDGSGLAGGGNVVVVTMNYRLGVLGFLGGFGTGDAREGNLGLKDQQKALMWIRDNISAFGGDPDNVTLFGLSAGASSVGVHLVNDASKGLFRRAIMQSNHCGMLFQNRNTANRRAARLATAMGCGSGSEDDRLGCLRAAVDRDMTAFLKTANPTKFTQVEALLCNSFGGAEYWAPMIDGSFVAKQPIDTVIDKPFMAGTTRDEGVYFISLAGQYPKLITPLYPITAPLFGVVPAIKITAKYVADNQDDFLRYRGRIMARIITDYVFHCANNQVMNTAINAGNKEVYGYYFTHQPSISIYGYKDKTKKSPGYFCSPSYGNVCHGNDIPYTFGTPVGFNEPGTEAKWIGFQSQELSMTGTMMRYWTGYATAGTPDSSGGFPKFGSQILPAGVYQRIAAESEGGIAPVTDLYDNANCRMLAGVGWQKNWLQEVCSEWPFAADDPS
jgi:para-nitrobenzyl esterase